MSKLMNCPTCEKEIAKGVAKCPNCGAKLKSGCFVQTIKFGFIGVIGLIVLVAVGSPSKEEIIAKEKKLVESIQNGKTASDISAVGLNEVYGMGTKATDIQRDNTEKAITGKIIEWSLPVYEVSKVTDNKYKIQTKSSTKIMGNSGSVGTFIYLEIDKSNYADNRFYKGQELVQYLSSLTEGNVVKVKGKIDGVFMRSVQIEPALLMK